MVFIVSLLNVLRTRNCPFFMMNTRIKKQYFNSEAVCAYQESGHILFACLCGYTCQEVFLMREAKGNCTAYSMIDYGTDAKEAAIFLTGRPGIDVLKNRSLAERLGLIEVGRRLSRIFFGGSVTASIQKHQGVSWMSNPVQVDIIDYMRLEYIHYIISELSVDKEAAFIEQGIKEALYTLDHPAMWNIADTLAQILLKERKLIKTEIETIVGQGLRT
jgi:hypothetical protein